MNGLNMKKIIKNKLTSEWTYRDTKPNGFIFIGMITIYYEFTFTFTFTFNKTSSS